MGNLNLQKSKKKSSTIGAFSSQKAEVKINLLLKLREVSKTIRRRAIKVWMPL
jgi:hypothetical protein